MQNDAHIPLHKIPNVGFIKAKDRHITRLIFPALYGEHHKSVGLTSKEQAELYEKVIREAALEVNPLCLNDWPPSHVDENWRTRDARGATFPGRKAIGRWDVEEFGRLIIEKCENDLSFGKGAVFLHQFRGLKATTPHDLNNKEAERAALRDLLQDLEIRQLQRGKWWVDVGMEVHVPGKAVLWRVDSHFALIKHFLDTDEVTAARNSREGQCYCIDLAAHLSTLGGFRLRPTKVGNFGHKVAYVQAYTTDKALTYQPGGKSHAKNITLLEAIKSHAGGSIPYIDHAYHAYRSALEKNLGAAARFEMRVELQYARADLHSFSPELIRETVVCIDRRVWWCVSSFTKRILLGELTYPVYQDLQTHEGNGRRSCSAVAESRPEILAKGEKRTWPHARHRTYP